MINRNFYRDTSISIHFAKIFEDCMVCFKLHASEVECRNLVKLSVTKFSAIYYPIILMCFEQLGYSLVCFICNDCYLLVFLQTPVTCC